MTTIKLLDYSGDIQKIAYLTRILASVPLRPIHRYAAMAIAADKNLMAENYGAASRFLRSLKARKLFDSSTIDKALADCEEKNFNNAVGYISPQRVMTCFSVCFCFFCLFVCSLVSPSFS